MNKWIWGLIGFCLFCGGASQCSVESGDPYADEVVSSKIGPNGGFGQENMPSVVLGPPLGAGEYSGSLDVLALGEGGEIILKFVDNVIIDEPGADLVVFENPFLLDGNPNAVFIEAGIVAVSDDGLNFFEFPYSVRSDQALSDPARYHNLAGLNPVMPAEDLAAMGGDTFDLADVGLARARFVKIRDPGSLIDDYGNEFETPPAAGFDLDAVAALHSGKAE
jgi:hypothetical protein